LENNQLSYIGEIGIYNLATYYPSLSPEVSLDFKDVKIKSFTGKMAAHSFTNNESINMNIFPKSIRGGLTIHKPRLSLFVDNALHIPARQTINSATLSSENGSGSTSFLTQTPTQINISATQNMNQEILISEVDNLYINTDYNTFKITGETVINPDGFAGGEFLFNNNNTKLKARASLRIPFNLKVDEVFFSDTISHSLDSIAAIDGFDFLEYRIGITNAMPLNLYVQAYFCDDNNRVVDSLFSTPKLVRGLINASANPSETVIQEKVNNSKIQSISSSSKIILRFKMDTSGNSVNLYSSNKVKATVRARVKYSKIPTDIF